MIEWVSTHAILLGQAFDRSFAGSYTYAILIVFWTLFANLWYFALLGPAVGVLAARLMTHRQVRSALARSGVWSASLAALVGMASPACTFASIPVVGGLLSSGFPVVPLMAFLVAAPLMNPSLFVITWGIMGSSMALARVAATFALAVAAAVIAQYLSRRGWVDFSNSVRRAEHRPRGRELLHSRDGDDGASGSTLWSNRLRELCGDFLHMTRFVFTYFVLSLLVAAALQVIVPSAMVADLMGGRRMESAVVGGLLGIPFYVCGGGAVATVAVLMSLNMGQGAALAFFLTGPATKISTLFSLFAVMRYRIIALYLAVTLVGGTLMGTVYGWVAPDYTPHLIYAGQVETDDDPSRYWQNTRPPRTWQWNR
jgi:uncharacterized membrane protein YraQ (UPF0718 family)